MVVRSVSSHGESFTGSITSFSKTGKTSLDLLDITFGAGTKATFSGTTAGGILTVTDGTHTAKINLKGNYTTSTFTTSSDGHGGTSVVDPKAKTVGLAPMHQFVVAMAGIGGAGGVAGFEMHYGGIRPQPLLMEPRPQSA